MKKFKLNYRKKVFKCSNFSDFIFKTLAARFGIPEPKVIMVANIKRSQFRFPDTILLSGALVNVPFAVFIQDCIHEFAHYAQWKGKTKKQAKMKRGKKSHGVEFYNYLILSCFAFFGKDWEGMEYAWEAEYPILQKRARRDGWLRDETSKS